MKRTPLNRGKGLNRKKPMSRQPRTEKAQAKAETWRLFSLYIRYRDSLKTTGTLTECACVTCGRVKPTRARNGIQAGHFIQGRHNSIIYDERQVRGQCQYCNDKLKGNWVPYRAFMVREYGEAVVDELIERDKLTETWSVGELEALQVELRAKIEAMGGSVE